MEDVAVKRVKQHERQRSNYLISIKRPPADLADDFGQIFTTGAVELLAQAFLEFDQKIDQLYLDRNIRKLQFKQNPDFRPAFKDSVSTHDRSWMVKPLPPRLWNRRLDLGDVSPSDTRHFMESLEADVQGIQVDFDDGHCPTWRNQIVGYMNIYRVVHGKCCLPAVEKLPVLMLRPRAWNMIEHNIMINGKEVPGPLVDFIILMYHNAHRLYPTGSGPFFYLSKLEGASEARLWNEIFVWTQRKLDIPLGTIKACVLIENILATFEMDDILFELREHSLGLNCGIWDYAASIISIFHNNQDFVIPDRSKYVNMKQHFLKCYMDLVIAVCHQRGAHATGGMAALLPSTSSNVNQLTEQVMQAKRREIEAGVDGFMVYDLTLVPYMNKLWNDTIGFQSNQITKPHNKINIRADDLLKIPRGGATYEGLRHNIAVTVLFINNWYRGAGHFYYKNAVEDSATAEISRSQTWQWIRHRKTIEGTGFRISKSMVEIMIDEFLDMNNHRNDSVMVRAANIFLQLVTSREFPDFITTYMNDSSEFRNAMDEGTNTFWHNAKIKL